jgi:hypothetical protein
MVTAASLAKPAGEIRIGRFWNLIIAISLKQISGAEQ